MRFRKSFWFSPLLVLSCVFLLTAASIPSVPTGTWQSWNSMGDARSGAAAVLLQDGRVLIIGGNNATGPVASADLFDTNGNFSAAAVMQTPRSGHTATVLSDGRVLVAGGTTTGGGITNSAEIYDPTADSWTLASGTMTGARSGHTASLLPDGRVLLAGGQNSGGVLDTLEIFNPASGDFSSAGVMASARVNHAATSLQDGRVIIIGGWDGTTSAPQPPNNPGTPNVLATSDIFDPSTGLVSAGPALNVARMSHSATTQLDGKVFVAGGNNGQADLNSAETFDPSDGNFTLSTNSLATTRSGHLAFLLPHNAGILIVGGTSGGIALASSELYYPWTGEFNTNFSATMVSARAHATGSPLSLGTPTSQNDGSLLVAGGTNAAGTPLSSTELYGFATVKTDAIDYAPGDTVTITGSGWVPGETVTLTLVESPVVETLSPFTAVADSNGNISNSDYSPDEHDISVKYVLTATGSVSQAQTRFSDSATVNALTIGAQTPNPVPDGSSATYAITVNLSNAASCSVTLAVSGLPSGATGSFSPNPVVFTTQTSLPSTLTVTTSASTPPGTSSLSLTQSASGSCSGGSAGTASLVVSVGPATQLVFTTQPYLLDTAGTAFATQPVVKVEDAGGHVLTTDSSTQITLAVTNGTPLYCTTNPLTDTSGVATFAGCNLHKTGSGYTLTATSTGLTSATSSTFTVNPGAVAVDQVETASDGSGTVVPAQNVTSGQSITVYGIGRDQYGNYITNESTVWSLTGITGGVVSGDLSPTNSTSTTFTAHKVGSATIHAVYSSASGNSGIITAVVGAASKLAFTTQPGGGTGGTVWATQPVVTVQDANGNTVTGRLGADHPGDRDWDHRCYLDLHLQPGERLFRGGNVRGVQHRQDGLEQLHADGHEQRADLSNQQLDLASRSARRRNWASPLSRAAPPPLAVRLGRSRRLRSRTRAAILSAVRLRSPWRSRAEPVPQVRPWLAQLTRRSLPPEWQRSRGAASTSQVRATR